MVINGICQWFVGSCKEPHIFKMNNFRKTWARSSSQTIDARVASHRERAEQAGRSHETCLRSKI